MSTGGDGIMDDKLKRTIGNQLWECRVKKGWTQAFVSRQLGISIRTISRVENGSGISKTLLQKMCSLYRVSVNELYKQDETIIKNRVSAQIDVIPEDVAVKILCQSSFVGDIQREAILSSYDIVESAFGKIDFIFSNKRLRQNFIYKKLHDRQRSIFQEITKEAWHFEQYYKMENGNLPVMLDKIMAIQDNLFEKQEGEIGDTIYNSYCYEIDKHLYELLGITYGKGYEQFVPDFKNYMVFSKIDAKKYKDANERLNRENSKRK